MKYILAIDQGTSGTKAVIFDQNGQMVSNAFANLDSQYPQPAFVEQDPREIYQSVLYAVKSCLDSFSGDPSAILSCGISNQRETFLLWDELWNPITNAIVWQCKRSVDICKPSERRRVLKLQSGKRRGLLLIHISQAPNFCG